MNNTWKKTKNIILYVVGGFFTLAVMCLASFVLVAATFIRIINSIIDNEDALVCFENIFETLNHLFDYYR